MTTLLILTARDQAIAAAWEAFLADIEMTWLETAL
jgi:hypothetical protein